MADRVREARLRQSRDGRKSVYVGHSRVTGEAVRTGKSFLFGEASPRTVSKVMRRLGVGCSLCGWAEALCDVHHIFGRRGENPHLLEKLIVLCPNHHRLAHEGRLDGEWWAGKTVEDLVGQERLDSVYYG